MSKYNSKRIVTADGVFDSKKEYRHWLLLKDQQAHGLISKLERQKKFELIPVQKRPVTVNGKTKLKCIERACGYVADFVYIKDNELIVEDIKGYRGGGAYAVFTIKRKLMLERYNIQIKEI